MFSLSANVFVSSVRVKTSTSEILFSLLGKKRHFATIAGLFSNGHELRMGSLGSNLTCWTRQPNGIGKEGPNSGQRRATGSGISGWVGRAGVFDQVMSLGFGWNE